MAPPALARLARVLGVDLGSLYSAAGYERPAELPALRPYLEIKFDLPPDAIEEMVLMFEFVASRHHEGPSGR